MNICDLPLYTSNLTSNLSTLLFKLFQPVGTFSNLSVSSLATSDFKLAVSTFQTKFDVSTPVAFSKSTFAAKLDKSKSTFTLPP